MVRRWSHAGAVDAPEYRQPAAGPAHPTPRPAHPPQAGRDTPGLVPGFCRGPVRRCCRTARPTT